MLALTDERVRRLPMNCWYTSIISASLWLSRFERKARSRLYAYHLMTTSAPSPDWQQSSVISVFVCLSVTKHDDHKSEFRPIVRPCMLPGPWLGQPLLPLRYVMYFPFCGGVTLPQLPRCSVVSGLTPLLCGTLYDFVQDDGRL